MEMVESGDRCLKFGVIQWMPFVTVTPDEKSVKGGIMFNILDIIADHLNICYEVIYVRDRNVGIKLPNGSWTGLTGMIIRNEVDMSGLGMSLTPTRNKEMDLGQFLYIDEVTAAYQRPTIHSNIMGFANPFTPSVWLMILASCLLVGIILCLVTMAHRKVVGSMSSRKNEGAYNENGDADDDEDNDDECEASPEVSASHILTQSLSWTLVTLLSTPLPIIHRGNSVRAVNGVWLLVSLVLGSIYRSNLLAMLILPSINLPFDNLQELARSHLPVCTNPTSMWYQGIVSSPTNTSLGGVKHLMVDGRGLYRHVPCTLEGFWRGVYVLMGPMTAISDMFHHSFSMTGKCSTYAMSERFFKNTPLGLLFPKGSKLKLKVDPIIVRLREAGILDHIYRGGVANATECLKHPSAALQTFKAQRPMDLRDFYGIFLIYAAGIGLSTLIFLLELLHGRKQSVPSLSSSSLTAVIPTLNVPDESSSLAELNQP